MCFVQLERIGRLALVCEAACEYPYQAPFAVAGDKRAVSSMSSLASSSCGATALDSPSSPRSESLSSLSRCALLPHQNLAPAPCVSQSAVSLWTLPRSVRQQPGSCIAHARDASCDSRPVPLPPRFRPTPVSATLPRLELSGSSSPSSPMRMMNQTLLSLHDPASGENGMVDARVTLGWKARLELACVIARCAVRKR
jgi:hypothetical protein